MERKYVTIFPEWSHLKSSHMQKKKIINYLFFLIVVCYALIIGCPFYRLSGTPCPGCGMTRAFLFALQLDFKSAFRMHPLFWVFMIETGYVLFRGNVLSRFRLAKKVELHIGCISLVLLLIVWIYRQFIH